MPFTPTGVEFIAKGFNKYLGDLGSADKAQQGLGKSVSSLGSFAQKTGGEFVGLGNNVLALGQTAGLVAAGGVAALAAGLGAFAVGGIKQAKDLDQQMADIAAVMGETKDSVTPLKDEILALSIDPQLRVNASQAADAVQLLARNGLDMTQILDGAAKSTVALANATGAEFGTAADVATDVMAIFGIEAGDMGRAIDGITGVTTHSKLTINDYALALSSTGAIAQGMGVSLEDMNTVLAATASSFSSGRVAGTSLKVLLQRLANPTDEMTAAMDKFGISLFDAEGNMRPMSEVAQQLNNVFQGTATITETIGPSMEQLAGAAAHARDVIPDLTDKISFQEKELQLANDELGAIIYHYGEGSLRARDKQLAIEKLNASLDKNKQALADANNAIVAYQNGQVNTITKTVELTEAEKAQLAATLGGADGARQIIALSKLTADEFDNLSGSVNDNGQALRAAATRVDSLSGAFDIFKSIVQSVQIQVGDKFLPILQDLTVRFTDLAAQVGPQVVSSFGLISEGIDDLIGTAGALFTAFQAGGAAGLVDAMGLTPDTIELLDKMADSAAAIGNAILSTLLPGLNSLAGGGLLDTINETITFINEHFYELQGAILGVGAVLAAGVFAALVAAVLSLLTPINLIIAAAALLGAAWAGDWFGIQEITFSIFGAVTDFINSNWATIQAVFLTGLAVVQAVWAGIIAGLQPLFPAFEQISTTVSSLGITWGDVWNAILIATGIVAAAIGAALLAIISVVISVTAGVTAGIASVITTFETAAVYFEQFVTGVLQLFQGNFSEGLINISLGLQQAIYTIFQGLFNAILDGTTAFVESLVGFWEGLYESLVGGSIVPDLINSIIEWFTMLPEAILGVLGGLSDAIGEIFGALFGGGAEPPDMSALTDQMVIIQQSIADITTGLNDIINVTVPALTESLTALVEFWLAQFLLIDTQTLLTDSLIQSIYLITLPTLQITTQTTALIMIAAIMSVIPAVNALAAALREVDVLLRQIAASAEAAAEALINGMQEAAESVEEAIDSLNEMIPVLKEIDKWWRKIAESARNAAHEMGVAGGTAKGATGIGFQRGTGPLGFKVPPGYPNDSFPIRVQSGEEVLVTPRGQTIEGAMMNRLNQLIGGSRDTNNTFELNVTTLATADAVIRSYEVAKSLL